MNALRHPRLRLLAGAGLILGLAGGLLAWSCMARSWDALTRARTELAERTRERDLLQRELAAERQRLRALEQVWSSRLELVESEKTAADRKLKECQGSGAGDGTPTRTPCGGRF